MSFSKQVKTEICANKAIKSQEKEARLYGLMLPWLSNQNKDVILIKSESEETVSEIFELIEDLTERTLEIEKITNSTKLSVRMNFMMLPLFIRRIIKDDLKVKFINDYCNSEKLRVFFLQGLFLSCGRFSNPQKEYRIEFVLKNQQQVAETIYEHLHNLFFKINLTKRIDNIIIYTKDSETIEEILTYLGSIKTCFEVMNTKIYKELRNRVNRITNCDNANIDKTICAAEIQIKKILALKKCGKFECLPQKLKKIAELRLKNPQASNSELASMLGDTTRAAIGNSLKKLTLLNKN